MGSTDDSSFDQKLKDKSESVKPKVKKTDQDNGTDNEQSLVSVNWVTYFLFQLLVFIHFYW